MTSGYQKLLLFSLTAGTVFLAVRSGISDTDVPRAAAERGLMSARSGSCAAMLPDGTVFITGGESSRTRLSSTEIFQVRKGTAAGAPMLAARSGHTCVALPDGRVLAAGGSTDGGGALNSAEMYQPSTGAWSAVGPMMMARANATASVLPGGKVLIAGGEVGGAATNSLEIFDSASLTFQASAQGLLSRRTQHAAVVLKNGKVLIAGGWDGEKALDSLEIYDPASGTVSQAGKMTTARAGLSATVLLDGKVFLAGGSSNGKNELNSTEIYSPAGNSVVPAASLGAPRRGHLAIRLPENNAVLIVGGRANGQLMAGAELYIPWWNKYKPLAALKVAQAASLGKQIEMAFRAAVSEPVVLAATSDPSLFPVISTDKDDYRPGETARITGDGWPSAAEVTLLLNRDPNHANLEPNQWSVTADANGHFETSYLVVDGDANETFTLTAYVGGTMETAQIVRTVTFTDSVSLQSVVVGAQTPPNPAPGSSLSYPVTVNFNGSNGSCWVDLSLQSAPSGVTLASFSPVTIKSSDLSKVSTLVLNTTGAASAGTFVVKATGTTGDCVTPRPETATGNGTVAFAGAAATTLTVQNASGTYGGTVSLSATLTRTSGGAAVAGKTISFALNGNTVGTGTTNASGVATFTTNPIKINAATYASGVAASFAGDAQNLASNGTAQLVISQASVTAAVTANNKTYDGNNTATVATCSVSPLVSPDVVGCSAASATFADKTVSAGKTVTASGITLSGAASGNYALTSTTATTTANITARSLVITATGQNKVYDGTTTATVTLSDDRIAGDVLTATYSAANFADKNVGSNKNISVTGLAISTGDAGNYSLPSTSATATAAITALGITVTPVAVSKVYDGALTSTGVPSISPALAGTDTSGFTQSYGNKNVGTSKPMTAAGTVNDGNSGNNYTVTFAPANVGTVTALAVTLTAVTDSKTYDGNTSSTKVPTLNPALVAGDTTGSLSQAFDSKNAGNRTLNPSVTINDGNSGLNYTVTPVTAAGTISPRALLITATGVDKVYDGTVAASVTLSDDRIGTDALTSAYTKAEFADKNVASNKPVSVTGISIGGADAGNYTPNTTASTTASITPRSLTVSATGSSKVYDGTKTATVTLSDNRVTGDALTLNYGLAEYDTRNVGTLKPVAVTGISVGGADAGNYALSSTSASTTGAITALAITVTPVTATKVYDGNTTASGVPSISPALAAPDTAGFTQSYGNKNVGTSKPMTAAGTVNDGNSGSNYTVTFAPANVGTITALAVTLTALPDSKTYDGNMSSTKVPTLNPALVGGDTTTSLSQAFDSKNAGNRTLTPSVTINDGNSGLNYTVTPVTAAGSISPRALLITATGVDKVYDGTVAASVTLSDNRVAGDALTSAYIKAEFADKNVASNKPVSVTGISIGGADAGNYTPNTTANTTANITPRSLTVSATGSSKVYDGTKTATVTLSDNRVAGDALTLSYGLAEYDTRNVGAPKPVAVTGISVGGADAGNYTLSSTSASTTGAITALAITVTPVTAVKVYDGNTTASGVPTISPGLAPNDTNGFTQSYGNKNVGSNKAMTVAGSVNDGNGGNNYAVTPQQANVGTITALGLTLTALPDSKTYDGNMSSTKVPTLNPALVGGDTTTSLSQAFDSKNAGNRTLTPSVTINDGNGGLNYTVTPVTAAGTISPRALLITATGVDKVYDGTVAASVTLSDNRVAGDALTSAYIKAEFADKNVASNKPVSVTGISIGGADAGNYTPNTTANTTANITPRSLTVSATGSSKVYDGTKTATVTLSDNRVTGDALTLSYGLAEYDSRNAGTSKPVAVTGISVGGADAGNYTLSSTSASTTGAITPLPITVTPVGVSRVYDGTTTATGDITISPALRPDDSSNFTKSYVTKHVGTNKAMTVIGSVNDANGGNNYAVTIQQANVGTITALTVTLTAVTDTKTYDGTTLSSRTPTISPALANGDSATLSQAFVLKDAGVRNLDPAATINDNNNGLNYLVTKVQVAGEITRASLTVQGPQLSKVYGTANPTLTPVYVGFVPGESASVLTPAASCSTSAGLTSDVAIYDVNCGSAGSINYLISYVKGSLTVLPAATTTTVTSVLTQATAPVKITLTASIGSTIVPPGSVQFFDTVTAPNTSIGTATVTNGQATLTLQASTLAMRGYAVKAVFTPSSANYTGSQSTAGSAPSATINSPVSGSLFVVNSTLTPVGNYTGTAPATAQWSLDDALAFNGTVSGSGVNGSYMIKNAGVYALMLTVTDGNGGFAISNTINSDLPASVVVYDPSGGFVTGGGWIVSAPGSYVANPSLTGKANFGFVSKYQKGANVPTGETEFNYSVGSFNFKSSVYEWLVVSGARAQYKGSGTVNGSGSYGFLLTAIDGSVAGGGGADKFRIKIWEKSTGAIVYDNVMGSPDDIDTAGPQGIGGGSIVIHSK